MLSGGCDDPSGRYREPGDGDEPIECQISFEQNRFFLRRERLSAPSRTAECRRFAYLGDSDEPQYLDGCSDITGYSEEPFSHTWCHSTDNYGKNELW